MAERVRVDPIDLHMSSAHMDMRHAELSAAHIAANGAIEEAQVGWAGTSAAPLQAKFAEWQAATAKLAGDIAAHGAAFQSAAEGYLTTDTDGAGQLDGQM